MAERLEDLLRSCTVQVIGDGKVSCTGFFVAPGQVVTTAQRIKDSKALTVIWERDGQQTIETAARPAALLTGRIFPIPSQDSGYPGIAVLQIDDLERQPCVRVDLELPRQDDKFLLFGYTARGRATRLSPTRLSYLHLGTKGSVPMLILNFRDIMINPTMHGAAVLNLRTQAVCGVMATTRDTTNPAGVLVVPWRAISPALPELLNSNRAFHERNSRWTVEHPERQIPREASVYPPGDFRETPVSFGRAFDLPADIGSIPNRQGFAHALAALRRRSEFTTEEIAARGGIGTSTVAGYFSGRHLPQSPEMMGRLLRGCGVDDEEQIVRWQRALVSVRRVLRDQEPEVAEEQQDDRAGLLFRVYIPSERLYASEAQRLLSLFRDWLIAIRRQGVRQDGYRTASGEMFEFFADTAVVQSDRRELFDSFSDFLTLCAENPPAAADLLAAAGLGRASSDELVARYGRDVRRLQVDLRHERERRMLTIRQGLEEQLLESGVDLRTIPISQINEMVESLVPGPSAPESLMLLAAPWMARPMAPVTVNISPQIISAMESIIVQNVQGNVHLEPQARDIIELIDRFGGQESALLESAVRELEDADAPRDDRSAAKRRLKNFLRQLAGTAHVVGIDLLERYLESKMGL